MVRLNASGGTIDFSTEIIGTPSSIALDHSGASYIAGSAVNTDGVGTGFLAKVASDGAAAYYTALPVGASQAVSVDAKGNVVLFSGFSSQNTVPGPAVAFALDAAGNAYVVAVTNRLFPVRNSLGTCRFETAPPLTSYSQWNGPRRRNRWTQFQALEKRPLSSRRHRRQVPVESVANHAKFN